MQANGGSAAHCASRAAATRFREATEEERATYRRWLRGTILFYCGLVFLAGIVVATYSDRSRSQVTNLSVQQTVARAH